MAIYQEVRVKPTNAKLNKSNSAAENKTAKIVRLNKKNFEDDELPHQSFLTTRKRTKIRNVFADKMSIDMESSKAQISKII